MKATIKLLTLILGVSTVITSCSKDKTPEVIVYYEQQDQMARPAIKTVFIDAAAKDSFNTTVPSLSMGSPFALTCGLSSVVSVVEIVLQN